VLPWPYIHLSHLNEIKELINAYPDLITITGNTSPTSSIDQAIEKNQYLHRYKEHFVYDPRLPLLFSARTRRHIKNGCKFNNTSLNANNNPRLPKEILNIYGQFLNRKNLPGNFFLFQENHFELFCKKDDAKIFITRDSQLKLSATALGYLDKADLHLVHIIISDLGLKNDAGYALMNEIIAYAKTNNLQVFFGGMPSQNIGGLYLFKKRWSNRLADSNFLKIIVQPQQYLELCEGNQTNNFFPAYRNRP
jgi:hypothetical protein